MTFKIATESGIVHVDGELKKIHNHLCFLHCDTIQGRWGNYEEWTVSDYKSGLRICSDLGKDSVIEKAMSEIKKRTTLDFIKAGQNELHRYKITYPLNK